MAQELISNPRPLRDADFKPAIMQKGVDLRIGLDVARIAIRGLAGTIVLVAGDSDLPPVMKFARREGLRVFLDPLRGTIRPEMKLHADRLMDSLAAIPAR